MPSTNNSRLPDLETASKPVVAVEAAIFASLTIAVLATFLFAWISDSVVDQHSRNFDLAVRTAIHHYASPAMTRVMFAITFMGNPGLLLLAIVAVILFLYFRWYRATLWLLITLAGASRPGRFAETCFPPHSSNAVFRSSSTNLQFSERPRVVFVLLLRSAGGTAG